MSFNENLQNLRNAKNMTQEELAEQLDVSRQAVSKWESGSGYPETEKIILICEIFNCSMDTLMKGKISTDNVSERKEYENMYNTFSKGIAFGVGLILFGVTVLTGLSNFLAEKNEVLGVIILMTCVLVAVPIFIYLGISMENFKKSKIKMPHIYADDEVRDFNKKFAVAISSSACLIIFGVIILIALYGVSSINENSMLPVTILLSLITISVPCLVYYSIQKAKYDIDLYNKEANIKTSKQSELIGKISGVIMLSAVFIFLTLGFIWNLWHIAWIVFPLGGLLCGIIGTIFAKVE